MMRSKENLAQGTSLQPSYFRHRTPCKHEKVVSHSHWLKRWVVKIDLLFWRLASSDLYHCTTTPTMRG